jgi:SAM-dependent methyltransferase
MPYTKDGLIGFIVSCYKEKPQQENYVYGKYDSVFEQSTPEIYDKWALDPNQAYDATVAAQSVTVSSLHTILVQTVATCMESERLTTKPFTILDAGCGTGRIAEVCRDRTLWSTAASSSAAAAQVVQEAIFDGMDYSNGMLSVCHDKGKDVYRHLAQADMKIALPNPVSVFGEDRSAPQHLFQDGMYQGVVCSGVFLQGHVGPEALPEMCRVLSPGGFMVFSVRPNYFEETKQEWLDTLAANGMVDVVLNSMPYTKDGLIGFIVSCYKEKL